MNALQQLYVSNVCLLNMRLDQSYTPSESGSVVEHVMLTLNAKDSSPNPGDRVNACKDAIGQLAFFKSALQTNDGVKLSTLSAPESAPGSKSFVSFTIQCRFSDQTR